MTMKLTVTFFLFAITVVTCHLPAWQLDYNCGIKGPSNIARIVGGDEATPHEFPWFASGGGCGASVINKDWLITAGHCLSDEGPNPTITYYFGTNNLINSDSSTFLTRISQRTFIHPNFTQIPETSTTDETPNNDIALVKLSESLPLDNDASAHHIGTICLPEPEAHIDALAGSTSIVCGFGYTKDPNADENVLRKVNVSIWKQENCIIAYNTIAPIYKGYVNHTMICAASYGKDTCLGDSGGPMVTFNSKTGRWQLTGVVSWGDDCALPYHPGVYTRVTTFLKWINETIQTYSD